MSIIFCQLLFPFFQSKSKWTMRIPPGPQHPIIPVFWQGLSTHNVFKYVSTPPASFPEVPLLRHFDATLLSPANSVEIQRIWIIIIIIALRWWCDCYLYVLCWSRREVFWGGWCTYEVTPESRLAFRLLSVVCGFRKRAWFWLNIHKKSYISSHCWLFLL